MNSVIVSGHKLRNLNETGVNESFCCWENGHILCTAAVESSILHKHISLLFLIRNRVIGS